MVKVRNFLFMLFVVFVGACFCKNSVYAVRVFEDAGSSCGSSKIVMGFETKHELSYFYSALNRVKTILKERGEKQPKNVQQINSYDFTVSDFAELFRIHLSGCLRGSGDASIMEICKAFSRIVLKDSQSVPGTNFAVIYLKYDLFLENFEKTILNCVRESLGENQFFPVEFVLDLPVNQLSPVRE